MGIITALAIVFAGLWLFERTARKRLQQLIIETNDMLEEQIKLLEAGVEDYETLKEELKNGNTKNH